MGAAPVLTILKNGETIKSCALEGESVLGRSEGCVIRLEDRAISRQHAVFRPTADGVQVEKKSEFAPLVVNGKECTKAMIKEGDVIALGPYLLKISAPAGSPSKSEPAVLENSVLTPDTGSEIARSRTGSDAPLNSRSFEASGQAGVVASLLVEDPVLAAVQAAQDGLATPSGVSSGAQSEIPEMNLGGGVSGPAESGPAEIESFEMGDEEAKTKLTPAAKLQVKLTFQPGVANVEEYLLSKDEISIGRGKNCDIVLEDKKASRKNTLIRKAGMNFVIKDLGSANGTYVNGVRVTEQELSGDEQIRIGDAEFRFQVLSAEYAAREKDFVPVVQSFDDLGSQADAPVPDLSFPSGPIENAANGSAVQQQSQVSLAMPGGVAGAAVGMGAGNATGVTGLSGIVGVGAGGKRTLMERFRAMPKRQQYLVIALVILGGWFLLEDDSPKTAVMQKPKPKPSAVATNSGDMSFDRLTSEQKKFVETQHSLAFDYYRAKDYDKALDALARMFQLVSDYKDSREIERYAKEGKVQLAALQEEKRKKEEEARLKAQITQLVDEARDLMSKKKQEEARELFSRILMLDPDNADVATWRKQLDELEEQKRIQEKEREVRQEINKHAWTVIREGKALKAAGKYYPAIETFQKVQEMGASDKRVLGVAKGQIAECRKAVAELREPVLQEAKQLEESGNLAKAYQMYRKATVIDPHHKEGFVGMNRLKNTLHERAKVIYTEAVLAESYSDFDVAKRKFRECLETAPRDDIYYERAERKLSRFFRKEDLPQ